MVPRALRGRPEAIVAVVLAGHELGLGPMQSLAQVNLIQGRPSLAAEAMRALVMAAGHTLVVEAGDDAATVRAHRRDWPAEQWATFRFTLADAERAGLLGKDTWKQYPRAMLSARATSEACRATFPDVLAGISYTPDELDVIDATVSAEAYQRDVAQEPPQRIDPLQQGADALTVRLNALPGPSRAAFKVWMRAEDVRLPPRTMDELAKMRDHVVTLEREAAAEADAYGTST
jgi:hypothetical protein